jgi:soluble lytic murein transglycosylase-like protein
VSSKDQAAADLAFDQTADMALPDTVEILPELAPGLRLAAAADAPAEVAYAAVPASAVADAARQAAEADQSVTDQPAAGQPVVVASVEPHAGPLAPRQPVEGQPVAGQPVAVPAAYIVADKPAGGLDALIDKYAALYEVPVVLVRRVVKRESNFNPAAYNRGHWGLMQIKHATARGMGYDGPAKGLLDAETNLKYAVKYLRGAFLVADGNHERADKLYQRGYYYDAKRKGLLDETGLGRDRVRKRAEKEQPGA